MQNIDSSITRLDLVKYKKEPFPYESSKREKFEVLFHKHAMEVRGKPFELNYLRYQQLHKENRLVWCVARINGDPIGYSCSFFYRDLHFNELVASDDLWYVLPQCRTMGVGLQLKKMTHAALKDAGVVRVYDMIRSSYNHPQLMKDLGFEPWGARWVKQL